MNGAAIAGAQVHVVKVPAPLLQEEHGAGGNKFNVIWVGEEGEDGGHGGMDSMLRQISHAVVTELHADGLLPMPAASSLSVGGIPIGSHE